MKSAQYEKPNLFQPSLVSMTNTNKEMKNKKLMRKTQHRQKYRFTIKVRDNYGIEGKKSPNLLSETGFILLLKQITKLLYYYHSFYI